MFVCRLGKVINNPVPFSGIVSRYLKELKIAIQCLGIKPKAIYMTPISRTLNVMAYQSSSIKQERPTESQKRQQSLILQTSTFLLAKVLP